MHVDQEYLPEPESVATAPISPLSLRGGDMPPLSRIGVEPAVLEAAGEGSFAGVSSATAGGDRAGTAAAGWASADDGGDTDEAGVADG